MAKKPLDPMQPPPPSDSAPILEAVALEMPPHDPEVEPNVATDIPIEVYERRLLGEEGLRPELAIPLSLPGKWHVRWINTSVPGRWATVVHQRGYIPVRVEEIADPRSVIGLHRSPEGYAVRGDRGQEVLVRMPLEFFERIKRTEAERRLRKQSSSTAQKEQLQNALASKFGGEAAEKLTEWTGGIAGGTERVES